MEAVPGIDSLPALPTFVPPLPGNRSFEKASPAFLAAEVGMNKDPLLVSPLCASQGGESPLALTFRLAPRRC